MGILSKTVSIKWNPKNKKWYESKGYIFTNWKDEFEVKVEDLSKGSDILVVVTCDNKECKSHHFKSLRLVDYFKRIKGDGKYYCNECASELFSRENIRKARLKNSKSFEFWCYNNLPEEEANNIMVRWDENKNIDINDNVLTPKDVSYSSMGLDRKGYWFKCLDHPEHAPEQKNIASFTHGHKGSIECNQCNTIAITNPELLKYLVNKDDALKFSAGSDKKILVKCQDCGFKKRIRPPQLIKQGFSCPVCSDGISYSEKFIFNILEQIKIDFEFQLTKKVIDWCKDYKYDFYINKIDCIIETHGIQHYEKNHYWDSLEEVQENDQQKEFLAKNNNITNYIVLDCRNSELRWIKKSVMTSSLPQLLQFKEEDIDWLECHEYACSSLVRDVCDLWNSGIKSTSKIGNALKVDRHTVTKYLKHGMELEWCDYDVEKVKKTNLISMRETNSKKIICLTTNEVFNSSSEASKKYSIDPSSISKCCKNNSINKTAGKYPGTGERLTWMYYDEYIKSNPIPYTYNDQEIKI